MMSVFGSIADALYNGDADLVADLTKQALGNGIPPGTILSDGLNRGMDAVGVDFKTGVLFVPEVLVAAQAMKAGMRLLEPFLTGSGAVQLLGCLVIGTVQGDLHDIGKNLVVMMMEGAGFKVHDLGTDVPPESFVEVVKREKANLVGMSALLTTTMPMMKTTIEALAEAGLRDGVRVMVGGASVTRKYASDIGADGYAPDAASAVDEAKKLLALRN